MSIALQPANAKHTLHLGEAVESCLTTEGIVILPPMEAKDCLETVRHLGLDVKATILDPWYNKGIGGVREDYDDFIQDLLVRSAEISPHVFLWGFPEIVARFVDRRPPSLILVAWLTWYFKNCPSVVRGWRSSQMACLHLSRPGAKLFPEHFLNAAQKELQAQGKLRYMPGPTSVIEESLLVGFVGRHEQTGHPSQKPVAVFEKLLMMTTQTGDLVLDPMSGSGTTGAAASKLGRRAILGDISEDYIKLVEKRLDVTRVEARSRGRTQAPRRVAGQAAPPAALFE